MSPLTLDLLTRTTMRFFRYSVRNFANDNSPALLGRTRGGLNRKQPVPQPHSGPSNPIGSLADRAPPIVSSEPTSLPASAFASCAPATSAGVGLTHTPPASAPFSQPHDPLLSA